LPDGSDQPAPEGGSDELGAGTNEGGTDCLEVVFDGVGFEAGAPAVVEMTWRVTFGV